MGNFACDKGRDDLWGFFFIGKMGGKRAGKWERCARRGSDLCFSCGSISSKGPALSRGLWVSGKQLLAPGYLQPFAGSKGRFSGEDALHSGPHVPFPSPSPFPGCSSFGHSPPGCSFYPSAASQPHRTRPLLPAFWGPFFSPLFFS